MDESKLVVALARALGVHAVARQVGAAVRAAAARGDVRELLAVAEAVLEALPGGEARREAEAEASPRPSPCPPAAATAARAAQRGATRGAGPCAGARAGSQVAAPGETTPPPPPSHAQLSPPPLSRSPLRASLTGGTPVLATTLAGPAVVGLGGSAKRPWPADELSDRAESTARKGRVYRSLRRATIFSPVKPLRPQHWSEPAAAVTARSGKRVYVGSRGGDDGETRERNAVGVARAAEPVAPPSSAGRTRAAPQSDASSSSSSASSSAVPGSSTADTLAALRAQYDEVDGERLCTEKKAAHEPECLSWARGEDGLVCRKQCRAAYASYVGAVSEHGLAPLGFQAFARLAEDNLLLM
jgi:hypothetical protein